MIFGSLLKRVQMSSAARRSVCAGRMTPCGHRGENKSATNSKRKKKNTFLDTSTLVYQNPVFQISRPVQCEVTVKGSPTISSVGEVLCDISEERLQQLG